MVCKRACCDFHSGMHLEEEVVNQSGKSKHWCEASVCVLASVPIVTHLFSAVNVVCDVDLSTVSVPDGETVEPQTFSLLPESVPPVLRWSVRQ